MASPRPCRSARPPVAGGNPTGDRCGAERGSSARPPPVRPRRRRTSEPGVAADGKRPPTDVDGLRQGPDRKGSVADFLAAVDVFAGIVVPDAERDGAAVVRLV